MTIQIFSHILQLSNSKTTLTTASTTTTTTTIMMIMMMILMVNMIYIHSYYPTINMYVHHAILIFKTTIKIK